MYRPRPVDADVVENPGGLVGANVEPTPPGVIGTTDSGGMGGNGNEGAGGCGCGHTGG
jgi:hypothetical protein